MVRRIVTSLATWWLGIVLLWPSTWAFVLSTHPQMNSNPDLNAWRPVDIARAPTLVLISGCTGAGKSTLGVALACAAGISRIVSTDSVRSILRAAVPEDACPALHRSSYSGDRDALQQWRECCDALQPSLVALLDDTMARGTSLVVEGVHVVPSAQLLDRWRRRGGRALGCLLTVPDEALHRQLLSDRLLATNSVSSRHQLHHLDRIRAIQTEMRRLAQAAQWLQLAQRTQVPVAALVDDVLARLAP